MVVVKKSAGGGGPQTLDILVCRVKIIQAELTLEEREIRLDNGITFMADPNLNCKFLVEKTSSRLVSMKVRRFMTDSS